MKSIIIFSLIGAIYLLACVAPTHLAPQVALPSSRPKSDAASGTLTTTTSTTSTTTTMSAATTATEDSEEPATSTLDTIGVGGSDEDERNSSTTTTGAPDIDNDSAGPSGLLEGRSISSSSDSATGDNALSNPNQASAKLSVVAEADSSPTGNGNNADDDGDEDEPDSSSGKPSEPLVVAASITKQTNRLNLSQTDYNYMEGRKDDQETLQSWQRMGKKLKKGIGGVIGTLVPYALNMSQEAKISGNCSGAMLKWVLSMNQLKSWALRMLDASGKPVAGLLEGSLTMFGNYRQCLKIRAPDDDEIEFAGEFKEYFRGKYCIIQAKPWLPKKDRFYNLNTKLKSLMKPDDEENQWYDKTVFDELSELALAFNYVNIRMDLCIPSVCTREDIQKAVDFILKGIDIKSRVLRCEMDASNSFLGASSVESGPGNVAMLALDANNPLNDSNEWGLDKVWPLRWILVPALALCLVLVATIISLALGDQYEGDQNRLTRTIRSLALKRSIDSHLGVDYDQLADDKPLALYGIRFVLILWIIMVESAINLKFEYLRELLMLKDLIFWWPMQFIINSTFQYESIILLTAFTMGYKNCLNDCTNSVRTITKYVLDKYIRLMPSIMLMVAFVILLPLAYKGPVWNDYVTKQSAVCQSTGWLNTVFLQNYLPYKEICLPQTWLMCVEFQLVLLMAPIVYYLNKSYIKASERWSTNSNSNSFNDNRGHLCNGKSTGNNKKRSNKINDVINPNKFFFWIRSIPGATLVGLIAVGLASSFYNVYSNDLPPIWLYTMADPDSKAIYFGEHMMRLWTHIAVFAIGILAGLECRRASRNILRSYRGDNLILMSHETNLKGLKGNSISSSSLPVMTTQKDKLLSSRSHNDILNSSSSISIDFQTNDSSHDNINGSESRLNNVSMEEDEERKGNNNNNPFRSALLEIIGYIVAITIMTTIIFSTYEWSLYDLPKPFVAGLYDASSRFLWSMALIWILYMVSVPDRNRNFSLLARLLGHPIMVFLGKLSFLIYMIHPVVHISVLAIQEQPIYSSWLMLFHILIGNITITVILASLVSLFVEMPCRNLFRRCGTSLLLTQTIDLGASPADTSAAAAAATGVASSSSA